MHNSVVEARPEAVVRAASAGDQVAFSQLLVRHHDAVLRAIRLSIPARLRPAVGDEDLLQETFTEAFRRLPTLRAETEASFVAWLKAIAVAKVANAREAAAAMKRGGARRRIPLHAGDSTNARGALLKALARQTRDPALRAADREGVARLRSTLGRMEDDVRTAVELRFLQGAAVTEAARTMGRESGAFRTLCWRALRRLRVAMAESEPASALR